MAPKTAKVKKAVEEKIIEEDLPKKVRGRGKVNVDKVDVVVEVKEVDTKTNKRSKKILEEANVVDINGTTAKLGRKKKVEEPVQDEKPSKKKTKAEVAKDTNGENGEAADMLDNKKQNKKAKSNPKLKQAKGNTKNKNTDDAKVLNDDDDDMKDENGQDVAEEEEQEKVKPTKGRGRKAVKTGAKGKNHEGTVEKEDDVAPIESSPEEEKEEDEPQPKKSKGRKPAKKEGSELGDDMDEIEEKAPKKTKVAKKESSVEINDVEERSAASKKTKAAKKEVKEKEDTEDDIEMEEKVEPKKTKGRKPKKQVESNVDDETQDSGEPTTKRARKATAEKAPIDNVKIKGSAKNKTATSYDDINLTNASESAKGKPWNFKISNWNVDGIRAWLSKGGLDYITYEKPNILCIQEIKCAQSKLPEEVKSIPGYHAYWLSSEKDGYAGVAVYTKELAINVEYGLRDEELDDEGRIITAEYEQFFLICTYVPNSSRKLVNLPKRLKWNEVFRNYVKELDKKKPVIICGDMNVAHNEIDLKNPKTNRKNAGFTDEERAGMTELLKEGFVDTFRHLNPDKTDAYTFWTYMGNSRAKNVGWRLDYFIISEKLLPSLCDSVIRNEVFGSDHCPISLFLHLTSVETPKE